MQKKPVLWLPHPLGVNKARVEDFCGRVSGERRVTGKVRGMREDLSANATQAFLHLTWELVAGGGDDQVHCALLPRIAPHHGFNLVRILDGLPPAYPVGVPPRFSQSDPAPPDSRSSELSSPVYSLLNLKSIQPCLSVKRPSYISLSSPLLILNAPGAVLLRRQPSHQHPREK